MIERKLLKNEVLIGNKPFFNYAHGVTLQFTKEKQSEVIIRARGKFISKAVDVAEVVKQNLINLKIKVKTIDIGTDKFKPEDQEKQVSVSTIAITLSK